MNNFGTSSGSIWLASVVGILAATLVACEHEFAPTNNAYNQADYVNTRPLSQAPSWLPQVQQQHQSPLHFHQQQQAPVEPQFQQQAQTQNELEHLWQELVALEAAGARSLSACNRWSYINRRYFQLSGSVERPRSQGEFEMGQRCKELRHESGRTRSRLNSFRKLFLNKEARVLERASNMVSEYVELQQAMQTDQHLAREFDRLLQNNPQLQVAVDNLRSFVSFLLSKAASIPEFARGGSLAGPGAPAVRAAAPSAWPANQADDIEELDQAMRQLINREFQLNEEEFRTLVDLTNILERILADRATVRANSGKFRYLSGTLDGARAAILHKLNEQDKHHLAHQPARRIQSQFVAPPQSRAPRPHRLPTPPLVQPAEMMAPLPPPPPGHFEPHFEQTHYVPDDRAPFYAPNEGAHLRARHHRRPRRQSQQEAHLQPESYFDPLDIDENGAPIYHDDQAEAYQQQVEAEQARQHEEEEAAARARENSMMREVENEAIGAALGDFVDGATLKQIQQDNELQRQQQQQQQQLPRARVQMASKPAQVKQMVAQTLLQSPAQPQQQQEQRAKVANEQAASKKQAQPTGEPASVRPAKLADPAAIVQDKLMRLRQRKFVDLQ